MGRVESTFGVLKDNCIMLRPPLGDLNMRRITWGNFGEPKGCHGMDRLFLTYYYPNSPLHKMEGGRCHLSWLPGNQGAGRNPAWVSWMFLPRTWKLHHRVAQDRKTRFSVAVTDRSPVTGPPVVVGPEGCFRGLSFSKSYSPSFSSLFWTRFSRLHWFCELANALQLNFFFASLRWWCFLLFAWHNTDY